MKDIFFMRNVLHVLEKRKGYFFIAVNFYVYFILIGVMGNQRIRISALLEIIPMFFGLWLSRKYPNRMRKIVFLCPLTRQERRKYLKTAYWIRILIPMAFCLSAGFILTVCRQVSLFYYVQISLLVFFYLMGVNIYFIPDERDLSENQWNQHISGYPFLCAFLCVFMQIMALLGIGVFSSVNMWEAGINTDRIVMTAVVLIVIILSLLIIRICYKPVMQCALDYEDSHPAEKERNLAE